MKPENKQTPDNTPKTIQAVKIDVVAQTIALIDIPETNTLKSLYEHIHCQTVSGFDLDGLHLCYIDDEGLLTQPEGYFQFPDFKHPLAGNAVIVGTNFRTGNDTSVKRDLLENVKENIIFFRPGETHVERKTIILSCN